LTAQDTVSFVTSEAAPDAPHRSACHRIRQADALGPEILYPAEFILEVDVSCQVEGADLAAIDKIEGYFSLAEIICVLRLMYKLSRRSVWSIKEI
jgi:hypothetical protein